MGDEPIDILINLPQRKRPEILGIWRKEVIVEGMKHVIYERPSDDMFNEFLGWIVPPNFRFIFDYLGVGLETRRMVLSRTDMSVNSKIVLTIPNFQCPDCGSHTELRILAGGGVDYSNPNLPKILFGNWEKVFFQKKREMFELADRLQMKVEELKIENETLRPFERENVLLRERVVELEHQLDILEEVSGDLRERLDGRDREFFNAYRKVQMKEGTDMRDIKEAEAVQESLEESKTSVEFNKQRIEQLNESARELMQSERKQEAALVEKAKRMSMGARKQKKGDESG